MLRRFSIALLCTLFITVSAYGEYGFGAKHGGASSATVGLGESIILELVLSSDNQDFNTSAVFEVTLSEPGLQFDSYAWAPPYVTGGGDDWSDPGPPQNAGIISSGDLLGQTIYFENFVDPGQFDSGVLLTLGLTVPNGFPLGDVVISATDSWFDNGLTGTAGIIEDFTLTVVPEPATLLLLGATSLILLRRRQRKA